MGKFFFKDKLNICFDVTWMRSKNKFGGGFQYSELLINALVKYTQLNVNCLVGKGEDCIFEGLKQYSNFKIFIYDDNPASFYRIAKREKFDLIHAPIQIYTSKFFSIPMVATIHDLQHYYFPQYFSKEGISCRKNYKKVAEASERIIVSYAHVKRDIIKYFHVSADKIDVCQIGYNFARRIDFSKWSRVKKKYHLPQNYLLYCANTWRHKNHIRLIKALKIVHKKYHLKISLICTGQKYPDYFPIISKEIKKNQIDSHVNFLGYIPEEDKLLILNKATLVVIPTLYEGGCLPLMEAMQFGVPVICSNVTSLPELIGNKDYIFDPNSVEEIAAKINIMLKDKNLRLKNIRNSKKMVNQLKWEDTIWQFIECYKKAIYDFRKRNFPPIVNFQDWKKYVYKPYRESNYGQLRKIVRGIFYRIKKANFRR